MATDRPLLGILLMLAFCVLAPFGDSLAKLLGTSLSVGQLVTIRFAVQAAVLVPMVLLTGGTLLLGRRVLLLTAVRTALHVAGISAMFTALLYLPLADAVAIAFVMPFLMLLLGWAVLGESVGPHRLGACAVGFVGTLLVLQPNLREAGVVALLPLGVAVIFALFMLATRAVAREVGPVTLQAVSGAMASVVLLPLALIFAGSPGAFAWAPQDLTGWGLILALGLTGTAAHLMMTASLRFAPAATLAPMQYLEIPFATLIGWAIFADLPGPMASAGIALTIGAGLYIIGRERRTARLATPAVP
ncbi:DMT family transporter [Pseudoroseicyclus tamaricis]|uniref:DMT family transporter n=1 Tax=Pseudoroseicyclus tamaricis TaxID=2705421 RepID=A0A6B2JG81_9RHOB|nr:DMT family transporter [Pseudoroseicyclus tamaricis]NDV00133.1 DMT family transporter [Pseudoroseicyclus tamaricis]